MHESTHEPISFPPLDVSTPEIVDPLTQVLEVVPCVVEIG